MNTKEKILTTAIEMFNQKGVSSVTIRHIAKELKISHGNLEYHYKNKGKIIEAIFKQMDEEMQQSLIPQEPNTLKFFHELLYITSEFQLKYRFFYVDIVEIDRRYPEVAKLHYDNALRRRKQGRKVFEYFVKQGLLKPEKKSGLYDKIGHTMWMMITFWISEQQMFQSQGTVLCFNDTAELIWNSLMPHFTAKGYKEYQRL